jgi:hypothetical protein
LFLLPKKGRNDAQSKKREEVAERTLKPILLSNKRVKLLFRSPIFEDKGKYLRIFKGENMWF